MTLFKTMLSKLGRKTIDSLWTLGVASTFIFRVIARSSIVIRRPNLLVAEMHFAGVLSLVIIIVSGLFVGLVLGLQGYETLKRYGSTGAVGTLVALSLVRELGPVVSALLFASRAGSAITAEIGIMKTTEQLSAMEMMAVDPYARVIAPMFWGGSFINAATCCYFFGDGYYWRLFDYCGGHRCGFRSLLVANAGEC